MTDDLLLRNAAAAQLEIPVTAEPIPQYVDLTIDLDREPGTGGGPIARRRARRERSLTFTYSPEEYLMALDILDTLANRWGLDSGSAVVLEALQRAADSNEA